MPASAHFVLAPGFMVFVDLLALSAVLWKRRMNQNRVNSAVPRECAAIQEKREKKQ
jgi:hypothetical protein